VDASDDPKVFTTANLKQYRVLVFSNSNNEAFENDASGCLQSVHPFRRLRGHSLGQRFGARMDYYQKYWEESSKTSPFQPSL